MDEVDLELIRRLHQTARPAVLALTGGGSRAVSELLSVPGASRWLTEVSIPYAASALAEWIGATPEQACSSATARAMAVAAWCRARRWAESAAGARGRVWGLGATCSLASDRPKRGAHRVHVAAHTREKTLDLQVTLTKGARTRAEEEEFAARLVLGLLGKLAELTEFWSIPSLSGEVINLSETRAPSWWQELWTGERFATLVGADAWPEPGAVLLPGSFHPLHEGHRRMAALAAARLGRQVDFELSIFNVDKPPLDYADVRYRAEALCGGERLWLTAAPTFVEKARLFPGATFVVGADTVDRIGQARYYGGSASAAEEAWHELAARGARFLVFGRQRGDGFETLESLELPGPLAALCEGVSAAEFRADISSTELRRQARSTEDDDSPD